MFWFQVFKTKTQAIKPCLSSHLNSAQQFPEDNCSRIGLSLYYNGFNPSKARRCDLVEWRQQNLKQSKQSFYPCPLGLIVSIVYEIKPGFVEVFGSTDCNSCKDGGLKATNPPSWDSVVHHGMQFLGSGTWLLSQKIFCHTLGII